MTDAEAGQSCLAAGRGAEAAAFFQRAIQREPSNAVLHYNMANALVKMKAHDRAIAEYQVSYMLDPRGQVSGYCLSALEAYKAPTPNLLQADDFQKQMRDTKGGALTKFTGMALNTAAPTEADRVSEILARQVSQEHINAAAKIEASKKTVSWHLQKKISDIDRDEADEIAHAGDPIATTQLVTPFTVSVGMKSSSIGQPLVLKFPTPEEVRQKEAKARQKAQERRQVATRQAEEEQGRYIEELKKKEEAMSEVARNLASQVGKTSTHGVRIHPKGTNLYVRQYAPFLNAATAKAHSSIARITSGRSDNSGEQK